MDGNDINFAYNYTDKDVLKSDHWWMEMDLYQQFFQLFQHVKIRPLMDGNNNEGFYKFEIDGS